MHKAQARVADAVPGPDRAPEQGAGAPLAGDRRRNHNLAALEGAIVQRTSALDKTMRERTETLQASLAARIEGLENSVAQGALLLDKTMKDRTDAFTGLLSQGAVLFDNTLKMRTDDLDGGDRRGRTDPRQDDAGSHRDVFTDLVSQGAVLFDNTLKQRTDELTVAIGEGAGALDQSMQGPDRRPSPTSSRRAPCCSTIR